MVNVDKNIELAYNDLLKLHSNIDSLERSQIVDNLKSVIEFLEQKAQELSILETRAKICLEAEQQGLLAKRAKVLVDLPKDLLAEVGNLEGREWQDALLQIEYFAEQAEIAIKEKSLILLETVLMRPEKRITKKNALEKLIDDLKSLEE